VFANIQLENEYMQMLVNSCSNFNYKTIRKDMMDKIAKITFKKELTNNSA
jgi:hypothetical protein